jgi:endonuclease/exonuclease/phosphatase (EEP) superfamily protein YafD
MAKSEYRHVRYPKNCTELSVKFAQSSSSSSKVTKSTSKGNNNNKNKQKNSKDNKGSSTNNKQLNKTKPLDEEQMEIDETDQELIQALEILKKKAPTLLKQQQQTGTKKCWLCKKSGHLKKECPSKPAKK